MTLLCKLTCQSHMKTMSWIQNIQLCLCQCLYLKQKSFCLLQLKVYFIHKLTTIFPSISNFQDETPCPPSDENEVPPEFDESLIDMSVHDIQQFIDGQQNKNTMKKTLRDVSLVEKISGLKRKRGTFTCFLQMN